MARLIVLYDPNDRIVGIPPEHLKRMEVKEATLSLSEDCSLEDLRAIVMNLANLLVDQI